MAGTQRAGLSQWWTTITDLSLAAQATAADLYTNGINRVVDRTIWLRDAVTKVRSDLAQTAAGTQATVVGSVDLSTLTYDSVTGSTNGLTLQTQADTGGVITTTFATGSLAPTGPADVVAAIAAAAGSAQAIAEDSAGHLNVSSSTTGGGSTINIVGGSAVSALGFTVAQNATGVSSGNDGISRVSGAAVVGTQGTIPAGTLRSMLTWIANRIPSGSAPRAEQSLIVNFSTHGSVVPGNVQVGSAGDNFMQMLTKLQHGITLSQVAFWLKPDSHGSMPQNKPTFAIYRQPIAGGSAVAIGAAVTDTSTNTTAYDVAHVITCPVTAGNGAGGTTEVVDLTQYVYYGLYVSESGTNSDALAILYGSVMTVTY